MMARFIFITGGRGNRSPVCIGWDLHRKQHQRTEKIKGLSGVGSPGEAKPKGFGAIWNRSIRRERDPQIVDVVWASSPGERRPMDSSACRPNCAGMAGCGSGGKTAH